MRSLPRFLTIASLAAGFAASCGGSSGPSVPPPLTPGQTDFTVESQGNGAPVQGTGNAGATKGGEATPVAIDGAGATSPTAGPSTPGAPGGRDATVEEADIYRIDSDRLFYFNTYRGLIIYDLTDPKNPKQLSRVPVYGYPVEMFVVGSTVYALLRDALYLSQTNGQLQFERHYVSQLVAIDVSDLHNPRVINTVDIIGELREGVSRKIENTIYLVSYISTSYYWGWGYEQANNQQTEQAWVYSFDISDPQALKQVGQLQVFQGGSVQVNDPNGLYYYNKQFSSVTISATSNALMVAENWWVSNYTSSGSSRNGYYSCGTSSNFQQSVVSIIDVSDPKGSIRRHTRFDTPGQVGDQFKMTYVFDPTNKTGTFYGIFARQVWSSANCTGTSYTTNTLESWDITDGSNPTLLSSLDFGKPNEIVGGSAFDVDRNVVYAITAQRTDPLYALGFSDPKNLKVLSAIDGLSGSMAVFRLIGDNKFLMGIGQDTSSTCTGFQDTTGTGPRSTNMAVSIIDVRDLSKVRLVQRQCVAVQNAEWVGSDINWNLDQAHKMIGMYSDDQANVVTVPVYYWTKSDPNDDWWWYQYKSAVGIMAWDLTKYDDSKPVSQQTVLQNYGTFIHPEGEVKRTIVFGHQTTGQRTMVNLSDTHASIANLQDLAHPQLQSIIEIAPYYNQVYQFGNYLVAQVQSQPGYYYNPNQNLSQFKVLAAGGSLDKATAVASFSVGQVQQAVKHGNQLLLFRTLPVDTSSKSYSYSSRTQVLVYDLTDPTHPRRAGSAILPGGVIPYYPYRCGWDGYWGGYWAMGYSNWAEVADGLVALDQEYTYNSTTASGVYTSQLVFLDSSNPDLPAVTPTTLPSTNAGYWNAYGLIADPVDPTGFYLSQYENAGTRKGEDGNTTFTQYKYYAQRWNKSGNSFKAAEKINLPGPLVRTWAPTPGSRFFMTQDQLYVYLPPVSPNTYGYYRDDTRLNLLRQITVGGKAVAELLDSKVFSNVYLEGLTVEGNTMYVAANQNYYYGYYPTGGGIAVKASGGSSSTPSWEATSDRLMIFDLSNNKFETLYDQPTKAYNLQIIGVNQGRLFLNLSGDGILAVDVSTPAQPTGTRFLRTLGWASYMEAFGDDLYVASGYFGLDHMSLAAPAAMPLN